MDFSFEEKATGFLVTLSYTEQKISTAIKEGNKEGNTLSVNQQIILDAILANPNVTIPQLSAIMGINKANVEKNLKKLREQGKIQRIGSTRKGYWQVFE